MLGKDWKQILNMDEARAIRKSAERAYSRRRQTNKKSGEKEEPWSAGLLVFQDLASSRCGLTDRTWVNCEQTLRDCDYNPDYRYMQMFLDVIFPLQWGFFDLHPKRPGRQWLFDTIIASEPMYHASLGLCLSFESGLKAGYTNGHCDNTPQVRSSQLIALRGLQPQIMEIRQQRTEQRPRLLTSASQALAIIILLTSLEIFAEAEGAWEVHQNAAGTVLDLIEKEIQVTVQDSTTRSTEIGPIGQLLRNSPLSNETQVLEFFASTYIWADILAEASHGIKVSSDGHFDYLCLLRQGVIDMRSTMGCHNSVMIAIKEVSTFALLMKLQKYEETIKASALNAQIRGLIREWQHGLSHAAEGSEADSCLVTLLYAYGALAYLQTTVIQLKAVVRGTYFDGDDQLDIHQTVTQCLELLEALPPHLLIRVCWPFTVAGCMASGGEGVQEGYDYHERFKAVLSRVESAGHVLGFTWKGLMVMEECWRLRRCKPESVWCWRTTMEHMQARILLI